MTGRMEEKALSPVKQIIRGFPVHAFPLAHREGQLSDAPSRLKGNFQQANMATIVQKYGGFVRRKT